MTKVEDNKLIIGEKEFEQINDKERGIVYDIDVVLDESDCLMIERLDMALHTIDSIQDMHMRIGTEVRIKKDKYEGVMSCVQATQVFAARIEKEMFELYEKYLKTIDTNFQDLTKENLGVVIEKVSKKLFITQGGA